MIVVNNVFQTYICIFDFGTASPKMLSCYYGNYERLRGTLAKTYIENIILTADQLAPVERRFRFGFLAEPDSIAKTANYCFYDSTRKAAIYVRDSVLTIFECSDSNVSINDKQSPVQHVSFFSSNKTILSFFPSQTKIDRAGSKTQVLYDIRGRVVMKRLPDAKHNGSKSVPAGVYI